MKQRVSGLLEAPVITLLEVIIPAATIGVSPVGAERYYIASRVHASIMNLEAMQQCLHAG